MSKNKLEHLHVATEDSDGVLHSMIAFDNCAHILKSKIVEGDVSLFHLIVKNYLSLLDLSFPQSSS